MTKLPAGYARDAAGDRVPIKVDRGGVVPRISERTARGVPRPWITDVEEAPPEEEIELAVEYLRRCEPAKTASVGSYGLKHWIQGHFGRYVSNGAAIAAALRLGLRVNVTEFGSINAFIGISKASIKKMRKAKEAALAAGR
jgi:hypothetical protein